MDQEQYHYLIYLEPSSNLWRWTLYNPLGRMAARSVENYCNREDCLAAITTPRGLVLRKPAMTVTREDTDYGSDQTQYPDDGAS